MKMTLDVPAHFNFWRTVYSHGWCALPPFHVDKENDCLKRLVDLPTGKNWLLQSLNRRKQSYSFRHA